MVVLNQQNGRPTLLMLDVDGIHLVAWMREGYSFDAEVWVYAALTADEAKAFVDDPPVLIGEWIATQRTHTRVAPGPENRPQVLGQIAALLAK